MEKQVKELPSLKDLVKDNEVMFSHFRQENFYYELQYPPYPYGDYGDMSYKERTEAEKFEEKMVNYVFPIPLEEIGNATLQNKEKAITMMRWIRQAIKDGTFVEVTK